MPRIDDQTTQIKRPFKKKPYRPWNNLLDDDLSSSHETATTKPQAISMGTNKESNSNQTGTNKEPISNQEVINKEPISNQMGTNKEPISNQFGAKTGFKVTNKEPISNQTEPKKPLPILIEKNALKDIQRVSGLQRKILFYIIEDCILRGELFTNPITNESLKKLTNADKNTLKTATQRLINKNLMRRGHGKKGKGGFAIFHITEEILNAVISTQKQEFLGQQLVTKKEPISTYSSSSINTTTTGEEPNEHLEPSGSPWETMDIQPLSHIGFTKTHLRQIIMDHKLPADIVQDSIHAFAFDLEKNNKEKTLKSNPLNYFMGILRNGKPYAPPPNYESPQDATMRIYLERKKEMALKRQTMEDELFQMAFKEWEINLSLEEKENLYPLNVKNSRLLSEKMACLRLYFKGQIWPSLKLKYLDGIK